MKWLKVWVTSNETGEHFREYWRVADAVVESEEECDYIAETWMKTTVGVDAWRNGYVSGWHTVDKPDKVWLADEIAAGEEAIDMLTSHVTDLRELLNSY